MDSSRDEVNTSRQLRSVAIVYSASQLKHYASGQNGIRALGAIRMQ
jgi:hypothetical protein